MMVEFSSASPSISFPPSLESWELDSRHSGCLLRLRKLLVTASGFRLVLLEFNDPRYRDQIIRQVDGFPVKTAALVLDESVDSFDKFERCLSALAGQCQAVHVLNLERWLADDKTRESRFKGFNYHREALAERCPFTLLLWMIASDIKAFALKAPDLWAWRTDVFDFLPDLPRFPLQLSSETSSGAARRRGSGKSGLRKSSRTSTGSYEKTGAAPCSWLNWANSTAISAIQTRRCAHWSEPWRFSGRRMIGAKRPWLRV